MYIDLYNSKDETYYNFPDRLAGKLNSLISKNHFEKEKIFFNLIVLCFFKVQLILTRSYPDHASDKTWNVLENLTIHFDHTSVCVVTYVNNEYTLIINKCPYFLSLPRKIFNMRKEIVAACSVIWYIALFNLVKTCFSKQLLCYI